MSPETLLEQFDALTNAPNGVQKLRELILQLAVRGALVSEDENDEPAWTLVERIEAEKRRLLATGSIQRLISVPPVSLDAIPYRIPANWEWGHIGTGVLSITGGATPSKQRPEYWDGSIPWASVKDLSTKFLDSTQDSITVDGLGSCSTTLIAPGHIIVCTRMGLGKISINRVPLAINQDLKALRLSRHINPDYFYNFYRAQNITGSGMTVSGIKQDDLLAMPFPIPPYAEQCRIVDKVHLLMALCDELEERQCRRAEARDRLNRAVLHSLAGAVDNSTAGECWERIRKQFDLLYESPEAVAELRKAMIGLACAGRLTEPARDTRANVADSETILNEIKLRQLDEHRSTCSSADQVGRLRKKLASQSLATPEPSVIPPGWRWASLLQICETIVDCHNKTAPYTTRGIPLIRTSNIRGGALVLEQLRYVTDETYLFWSRRCPPEPGDILFTREAPMGEAAIVPAGMKVCLGQRTMLLRVYPDLIERQYVLLALQDPAFQTRMQASAIGMTVKHLRVGDVESLLIPLPPLDEQREIVRVTHQLLAFCDALQTKLTDARSRGERLASAVVHHLTTA